MLNEFQLLVKENRTNNYKVTFANGECKVMRLFYHDDSDTICYYKKRSRKFGFPLYGYTNIELVKRTSVDSTKKTRRFLNKLISLLNESKLWDDLLKNAIAINNLSDEDLCRYLDNEWENADKLGVKRFGTDTLWCTVKKGFKKINYSDDTERYVFDNALKNQSDYNYFWRKAYDNRISCKLGEDGKMRAWYSEEYKDCGNGHYYLAINATHAIFCEDD